MNNRYFIKLSYDGSAYHGWQRQTNAKSVQEVLEHDLGLLLSEEVKLTGCGRTDTGVHAGEFYAHMDLERENLQHDPALLHKINRKLPVDIVISECLAVVPDAHARYSALSRTYEYQVFRKKEVFRRDYGLYLFGKLNISRMSAACQILKEFQDFTSFSKVDTDTVSNDCRIDHAEWIVSPETLVFRITADRFLRNMVRAIVGTMLDLGKDKMDLEAFRTVIESRDRSKAGASAPARALSLNTVTYPPELFL